MRIGIISEGPADTAVITNILKGITGLDSNDIVPLRPRLKYDNTHLAHLDPDSHGSWTLVRQECVERKKIEEFLSFEDSTHILIHIDSAEAALYGITLPEKKGHAYCEKLRALVINKIHQWLEFNHLEEVIYAIAIEETDAWVLTIFEDKETCFINNPKNKLRYIARGLMNSSSSYDKYLALSDAFSKEKKMQKEKLLLKNCSLRLFHDEVRFSVMNKQLF
jgi:hypothetical protein